MTLVQNTTQMTGYSHRPAPHKLALLLSHPIQYHAPLLSRLAARSEVDPTVYFMSDLGLKPSFVQGFGETIQWDRPLLDGYRSVFLKNVARDPRGGGPLAKVHPEFIAALRKGRYDALFLHGYASVTEWMAYAAARAMRIPILFHGDVVVDSPKILTRSQFARDTFRKQWCAGLGAALAMSSQARQYYDHYGVPKERVFWVPLCVDNEYFMARADELRPKKAELKAAMGLDPNLPVIIFVAHMRDKKRPMDLVRAHQRMKQRASLVMIGGGPLFDSVRDYCAANHLEHVYPVGAKNQTELPSYYAMADVFALVSGPGEVTPLVIHEAMCFSLPLVLSDAIPSTIDFLRPGENGQTFPWGDLDRLATTLDGVVADEAARAAMGRASRELISKWTYSAAVDGIVDALAYVTAPR